MSLIGEFNGWKLLWLFLGVSMTCGCEKKKVVSPPPEVRVITVTATNVPVFQEWGLAHSTKA